MLRSVEENVLVLIHVLYNKYKWLFLFPW